MTKRLPVVISILICAVVAGCSNLSHEIIGEAKDAIKTAKKAEAGIYAPAQLRAAEVSFELGQREYSVEIRKLPFMRKFNNVNETFKSATRAAQSAARVAREFRERTRIEAGEHIAASKGVIDSMVTIYQADSLHQVLDSAKADVMLAETAYSRGDYMLARQIIGSVQERLEIGDGLTLVP